MNDFILIESETIGELYSKATYALAWLHTWLYDNKPIPNVSKTSDVIFHPPKKNVTTSGRAFLFNDVPPQELTEAKFLDTIILLHLHWPSHIQHAESKIRKYKYILYTLR